ncbi:MAG TPA: PepSY domain-containing protein [Geminicoccaceae bacterium]|nr:PepSY domain-containing protein [Geminicoccaceae bacterium]
MIRPLPVPALACLLALALALPARADPPPPNAQPLSQILQALEQQGDVAWFKDIDWDDDGWWEIEYVAADGSEREIKIDPVTGRRRD